MLFCREATADAWWTAQTSADCETKLGLCNTYVDALEQENAALQELQEQTEVELRKAHERNAELADSSPVLPEWALIAIGAAAGLGLGAVLGK